MKSSAETVLIVGSGPIVIGQACEFDYSGTQACRVLKQEGLRVVLVNSNPATIMTDPEVADRTYVEPITPEVVARILLALALGGLIGWERERQHKPAGLRTHMMAGALGAA